ncbi:precorrin-6y C5,15-methyltransferase (decarboxylating) subunit CbiE [Marinomonas sp. C2222]|uniref:Precorrin-6y C5,15-methyltransferase (Decarboxylating) subunit CbiE n=1 Tax=Marinomonas sargassi TaxID=2984494 RepID=A0ABT2YN69_9GAMM|nr:precorrin-6y C5,15-methyltransferase (decarboxylating) subunit CbiE [Marinomonas sargassi]MCV2401329.1 precorrin-6y C5,15-methyltransferase (decarboxylating) subunit CbiE [Marinomonas sargassi]
MKIHVIGLGVHQFSHLDSAAQNVLSKLSQEDIVLGSPRQHDMLVNYPHAAKRIDLPKLSQLKNNVQDWQIDGVKSLVVLASGDPLFYGIGAWLGRNFPPEKLTFYPNVSSIQMACHRLGLSLQDVETVSLHGRPLGSLRRHLQAHKTLALLTDQYSQPKHIAQECVLAGLDDSKIFVCEALGYETEKVRCFVAKDLQNTDEVFYPLNVIVVKTSPQKSFYPSSPGFPDPLFVTDKGEGKGMITKREMRLAILSLMNIENGDLIWDIGAGCGGVSSELSYWHPKSQVVAIEHHPERLACLKANQERFGLVQNLSIIAGRAPDVFQSLSVEQSVPNKVFIGGSDGELASLLAYVWSLLPAGGCLVVNAVTEETKYTILDFANLREEAGDSDEYSLQLTVNKAEKLAGQRVYRPSLPVTLFQFRKKGTV